MTPEIGSLWRRRANAPATKRLRFDRVIVVEDEDELYSDHVCIEPAPKATIKPSYPLAVFGNGFVQAFEPEEFAAEYEPDQLGLF